METMHTDSKSTRRDAPVFSLVSIDEWQARWTALEAETTEEPLDPREWGGPAPVSGYDTTCVAGRVLS